MGLGSALKKGFKSVGKVFKKVLKPFAKIMQSKAFKVISLAATVVGVGMLAYSAYGAMTAGTDSAWANVGTNLSKMATDAGTWIKELPQTIGQSWDKFTTGMEQTANTAATNPNMPMGDVLGGATGDVAQQGVGDAAAQAAVGDTTTAGINTEAMKSAGMDSASLTSQPTDAMNYKPFSQAATDPNTVGTAASAGGTPTNITNAAQPGLLDRTMDGLVKYAPVAQVVGAGAAAATSGDTEGDAMRAQLEDEQDRRTQLDAYLNSQNFDGGAEAVSNSGITSAINYQRNELEGLLTRSQSSAQSQRRTAPVRRRA
jgi:hypothetical protein